MEVITERCCGIDVHKKTIVVCLMIGRPHEKPTSTIKTFSTMTRDLLACKDWLESEGCTHVAMESTGVYWKPVFNILEDSMQIILANARHIKNVPGRKTDVKDCEWIAQLLRHGLIKGSFIPPRPIRELRDLTRYRRKLIQQRSSELNRVQKFLEDANIKLSSVVTDINGVSAQDMIYHLIKQDMTPQEMADLAKGRLRTKITELEKALEGALRDHHRLILAISIQMIASYDQAIDKLDSEIDERMKPYAHESERLQTIPGIKKGLLNPSWLK
jgi:transposase